MTGFARQEKVLARVDKLVPYNAGEEVNKRGAQYQKVRPPLVSYTVIDGNPGHQAEPGIGQGDRDEGRRGPVEPVNSPIAKPVPETVDGKTAFGPSPSPTVETLAGRRGRPRPATADVVPAATLWAARGITTVRRVRWWKVAVVVPEASRGPAIFTAVLRRWPGTGGWVFAPVPDEHAPGRAGSFGRVPVTATVNGHSWSTSVWRDRTHGWLLAVPAKVRRGKEDGDAVSVEIELDHRRL